MLDARKAARDLWSSLTDRERDALRARIEGWKMPSNRWASAAVRVCVEQIACDGRTLTPGRPMCRPCQDAIDRRKRLAESAPLRGERCLDYEATRPPRRKRAS